jgi:serine protease Do
VLARVTSMRGVDLNLFDFDYDLTWMAFFISADEKVYGRFGGRTPGSATAYLSLDGVRHALAAALAAHRAKNTPARPIMQPRTADELPAARRLPAKACIHCHHVYDFRREEKQTAGTWTRDEVWVYPLPENLGLTLDAAQGNRIQQVAVNSAAASLGLRAEDVLTTLNGKNVRSFADAQHALHIAPPEGRIAVSWRRVDKSLSGELKLSKSWRETDVSWRWSLRGLQPASNLHGDDLSPAEKKALGLGDKQLAFRQGNFVTPAARHAGLLQNDIILGFDGNTLDMTAKQFDAYVRLNYRVGAEVKVDLLRNGKRLELTMKLPG